VRAACPAYLIPFDLLVLSKNQPLYMMPGYWHLVQLPNYLTSYRLTFDAGISDVMEELTDYELNPSKISVFNLL
jgi:hypothetical protein